MNFEERCREVWKGYSRCDIARNWKVRQMNENENSIIGDCEYSVF